MIRKEELHPDGVLEDVIYPKTSIDQVEGLQDTIDELDSVDVNLETRMTNTEATAGQNSIAITQLGNRVNALEQSSGGSLIKKFFTQRFGYVYVFDTFPTEKFISVILGGDYDIKISSTALTPSWNDIVGSNISVSFIFYGVNLQYYDGSIGEYGTIENLTAKLGYYQGEINGEYNRYPSITFDIPANASLTEQQNLFDYVSVGYIE